MIRIRIRRHPSAGELLANCHGELPGPERSLILAHLKECPRCREAAAELLSTEAQLGSQLPPFPETLLEQGKETLLRAARGCTIDEDSLSALFGGRASIASCRMIEELLGAAATPG